MDDPCDVCLGLGKPRSERPCICGGVGTAVGEKIGLRKAVWKLDLQISHYRNLIASSPLEDGVHRVPVRLFKVVQAGDSAGYREEGHRLLENAARLLFAAESCADETSRKAAIEDLRNALRVIDGEKRP